ncbi:NAD(P)H-dependent oxidoreductase [Vulcanibacillus modesticaldus]|uniref:NAD(P)H-dependent oxidoreductase n=1 Tax=Vulcanibacillus modesticaldus TaxID=337097 RepID=A0A1D2YWL3_9BACI|nr:flavodoxin family protein [Vulcanibacillus modesticaldus]OEG00003.1 NAD(P)H-dependent oxidoreductase [Vulcanibacillus modesticaldus]
MKLLAIYGSSRKNGNTEALTKIVLQNLDKNSYNEIFLMDYQIKPIIDQRHTSTGFQRINDDYDNLAKELLNHDAILFATPLYWYGMSGQLKIFIDRFSQSIRSQEYDFKEEMKGKKIYLVIVGGESAPYTALPLVQQFQLICQFLELDFRGYIIGKGVKPLEVLEDEESILQAKQLGKKIKTDLFK